MCLRSLVHEQVLAAAAGWPLSNAKDVQKLCCAVCGNWIQWNTQHVIQQWRPCTF